MHCGAVVSGVVGLQNASDREGTRGGVSEVTPRGRSPWKHAIALSEAYHTMGRGAQGYEAGVVGKASDFPWHKRV